MVEGLQGDRMNDQRVSFGAYPGLIGRRAAIGQIPIDQREEPLDDNQFLDILERCQVISITLPRLLLTCIIILGVLLRLFIRC